MSIYKSVAASYVFQMSATVLNAVMTMVITRLLGPSSFGNYQLMFHSMLFLSLLLGLNTESGTLFIAPKHKAETGAIARSLLLFAILVGVGSWLVVNFYHSCALCWEVMPQEFFLPLVAFDEPYLLLLASWVILNLIKLYFTALVNGHRYFLALNIAQTLLNVVNLIIYLALYLMVKWGYLKVDFEWFVWWQTAFFALAALLSTGVYFLKVPQAWSWNWPSSSVWAQYQYYAGYLFLGAILQFLNYRMGVWFVSAYLNKAEVGFFSLANQLSMLLLIVSNAASQVFVPYAASADRPDAVRYLLALSRTVLWLNIILGGMGALLSPWLLPLMYGSAFSPAVFALVVMVPGMVINSSGRLFSVFNTLEQRLKVSVLSSFAGLLVGLIAYWWLTPIWGVVGAGIATSLSHITNALANVWVVQSLVHRPWAEFWLLSRADFEAVRKILLKK